MDVKINIDRVSNGLYILLFGFVFLWMSLGFIKWNMLFQILRLWPLLFIIVGLDLILRKTAISFLRVLIPIVVIGAVISLLYVAQDGNFFQPRIIEKQKIGSDVVFPDKIADFNIDFYSGKLKIGEGQDELVKADISMPKGESPILIYKKFDKEDLYEILDSHISNYVFSPWDGGHVWDFRLNKQVPIKLNINTYASTNEIDLSQLTISDFNLDANFSSNRIIIGKKTGNMSINASGSSLTLEIPKNMGVGLKLEKMFIEDNFETLGFTQGFKEFKSPGYKDADNKVDIDLNLKFSKIEIKFY